MSTNEHPENKPAETEKGFGTGLRAQLERRREEEVGQPEAPPSTNVELRFELTARPSGDGEPLTVGVGAAELAELRSELEAALRREETLRLRLEKQTEAYDGGIGNEKELARRAATLDERDAKLAEFEFELEERERKTRVEREAIEAEHGRVADLQAELTAEQQLAAEQQEQAEKRIRDLAGADRSRAKAEADLAKQLAAFGDREKKLANKEHELDARERATEVRLQGRERSLEKRENEWRSRDKELSEREILCDFRPDSGLRACMDGWLAHGGPHHQILNPGRHADAWRVFSGMVGLEFAQA